MAEKCDDLTRAKPRFGLREWRVIEPFLSAIADTLENSRHYLHSDWPHVASDVLDGWAREYELEPLVRHGILETIHDGGCGCKHRCAAGVFMHECGQRGPTWHLTPRGLRLLSPYHPAASPSPESTHG